LPAELAHLHAMAHEVSQDGDVEMAVQQREQSGTMQTIGDAEYDFSSFCVELVSNNGRDHVLSRAPMNHIFAIARFAPR
jgi:hypothetical protein